MYKFRSTTQFPIKAKIGKTTLNKSVNVLLTDSYNNQYAIGYYDFISKKWVYNKPLFPSFWTYFLNYSDKIGYEGLNLD